ncbi:MAG: SRPBCC family protein [Aquabacterium sp.]|uniref:SRPBCC family protein n=1 Tax=Aquabacterium sp. TaxID=1872578 RepID=UPI00271BC5B0|nr:SRPBCC family protein [Aquabacterium sp.]MDO9004484.1 SRPBCC family protein [Aquabacterium sp.]
MIKTIFIIAAMGIAGLLFYAASKPDTFAVQRSISIKASTDQLHSLINDLHQFNTWNPYNQKDPKVKGFYSGPVSGPGARYEFEGNKDVGKGSIQITDSTPSQVAMKLDIIEPFEGHNLVEFTLRPQDDTTEVTWAMRGPAPFMFKLVGIFMNMDQMIGRDFETGLNSLKTKAEKTS